jgi:hypothetical protein
MGKTISIYVLFYFLGWLVFFKASLEMVALLTRQFKSFEVSVVSPRLPAFGGQFSSAGLLVFRVGPTLASLQPSVTPTARKTLPSA